MVRYFALIPILACISLSDRAMAQSESIECQLPNDIQAQPSYETWLTLRDQLAPQLEQCLNSTDYFALYGASLLYTNNVARALEMLERALLINPLNGSARLDYAEALYLSGQLHAAIQVNQNLLDEGELPEHIRTFVEQRDALWQSKRHLWQHQVSYLYGHSDNLNNATQLEELNVIQSGRNGLLTLNDDYRANTGYYQLLGLRSQHFSSYSDRTSVWEVSLRSRNSEFRQSDTDELATSFEAEYEGRQARYGWQAGIEHILYGGESLYSAANASWKIATTSNPHIYAEIDGKYIAFDGQKNLNEASTNFQSGIAYQTAYQRFGAEAGVGFNKEIYQRPGGDRFQKELSLYHDLGLLGGKLSSKLSYALSQDDEGYSIYFGENSKRDLESISLSLQYIYPINRHLLLHASYYNRQQDSNIELFETETQSVDMGFTYRF